MRKRMEGFTMNIMVTGAAGGYGSYALDYLKRFAPDANIYGLVHNAAKGKELEEEGIQVRVADYADRKALVEAFDGIDRLLFVSVPVFELQRNVVAATKEAGVKFIAYTSIADPQYSKFGLEINHRQTEQLIAESGIPYVILRDNWYLELVADYMKTAVKTGRFPYYAGTGKIAFALKREYAEAGARVIAGGEYPQVLTLAGKPVSFPELAKLTEEAAGRKLDIYETSKGKFLMEFAAGEISDLGRMLAASYQDYAFAGNNGEEDLTTDDFETVLGHPVTPLADAIRELL